MRELHDANARLELVSTEPLQFRLLVGDTAIQTGPSARELSNLAFGNGAMSVRWPGEVCLAAEQNYRRKGSY